MIHIIGSGWYGCHIAQTLRARGYDVEIWEKADAAFSGASSKNQNRLHLGFHYPRSFATRQQSRQGFDKFIAQYGGLTEAVPKNHYGVARQSLIDGPTYKAIFSFENYDFNVLNETEGGYKNLDLLISTPERLIRHDLAVQYWSSLNLPIHTESEVFLNSNAVLFSSSGKRISAAKDFVIDCSWGGISSGEGFYQQFFITFIIQIDTYIDFGAFTLMDGQFFSIFPYGDPEDKLYTLTHVKYGVLNLAQISDTEKSEAFAATLLDIKHYLSIDLSRVILVDSFVSRKLKPVSYSDSRDVSVDINKEYNFARVYSGKIDTVFHAVAELDAKGFLD